MRKAVFLRYMRVVIGAIGLAAAAIMQCSLFPHIRLFGAIPDLALCAVAAISCYEEERTSCCLAVAAGALLDAAGKASFFISPVLFLLTAAVAIFSSRKLPRHRPLCAALAAVAGIVISCAFTAFMLMGKGADGADALVFTVLPQALYGLIVFFPVCLITMLHYKIFGGAVNEK